MIQEYIIAMGSNIDADRNFSAALNFIRQEHQLIAVSSTVITAPIGISDQPDFLNGAAKVISGLNLAEFKGYLKGVEDRLKRDRSAPKYGPRTIDLDIIVWNGRIIDRDYYDRDFIKELVDEIL